MRFDWAMFAGGSLAQSAASSGSFLRLSFFPWTVRPGQAGRLTHRESKIKKIFVGHNTNRSTHRGEN